MHLCGAIGGRRSAGGARVLGALHPRGGHRRACGRASRPRGTKKRKPPPTQGRREVRDGVFGGQSQRGGSMTAAPVAGRDREGQHRYATVMVTGACLSQTVRWLPLLRMNPPHARHEAASDRCPRPDITFKVPHCLNGDQHRPEIDVTLIEGDRSARIGTTAVRPGADFRTAGWGYRSHRSTQSASIPPSGHAAQACRRWSDPSGGDERGSVRVDDTGGRRSPHVRPDPLSAGAIA